MTGLKLSSVEADFALSILEAFGEARFSLADYFARIERGRYQRMPDPGQNERMREKLARYTASQGVLLSAPGPRGGVGWRLNPAALPALRRRESVLNARATQKQQEYETAIARAREIQNKPHELREALAARLRATDSAESLIQEVLAAVDSIVAADRRARGLRR